MIRSYKDLDVWQKSMVLAEAIYRVTKEFPREELYGLTTQARRASISIPANIAEGYGRESTANFIQFLRIAQGSLKELETHLMLCERVELFDKEMAGSLLSDCDSISKMLRNLIRSLETKMKCA